MNGHKGLTCRISLGMHEKVGSKVENEQEADIKHEYQYGKMEKKINQQKGD